MSTAKPIKIIFFLLLFAAGTLTAGCDLLSGSSGDAALVSVSFGVASDAAKTLQASKNGSAGEEGSLEVEGDNGLLRITDLRLLVDKFKIEFEEAACEAEEVAESESEDEDERGCEEFESEPAFVDLPLPSGVVAVASDLLPSGAYKKFEFEVDDLDLDEDEEEADVQAIAQQVRTDFPAWPDEASMVVVGEFFPRDETTGELATAGQPFETYIKAEIEIEMEFPTELAVDGEEQSFTIKVLPEAWFKVSETEVLNLAELSYDPETTQELPELSWKMKEGFAEVEID